MSCNLIFKTKDRRRFQRVHTIGNIDISYRDSSRAYEGKIYDISEDGMRCATDLPLNILNQVDIQVHQSDELPQNEHFRGKVVWNKCAEDMNHGKYIYGIKLIFPSRKTRP